ncbi:DUF3592 domain-containing protein [Calothrix sp. 336/3]|uniref:DUF3592 domain-containing protein n=1 Tax=Calothrix sp. 336/3 TaxID=1337936 RepID=UPI00069A65F9|nr:DUF3592 domain-containing protein [Calothrix sp. 336/3]
MNEKLFWRIFGSIFGGVGSIFALIAVLDGVSNYNFISQAKIANGTIVDIVAYRGTDNKGKTYINYQPVVQFNTIDGKSTIFTSDTSSSEFTKGKEVKVYYQADNPNNAKINSWISLWLFSVIFGIFGSVLLVIGIASIIKSFYVNTVDITGNMTSEIDSFDDLDDLDDLYCFDDYQEEVF